MEAYPLQWPVGYERTAIPERHPSFRRHTSFAYERDELLDELRRLKAKEVVISSNIPVRQDGMPKADYLRRSITDVGVAVYFKKDGEDTVLACDAWDSCEHNVRALTKTIEDLRGLARNRTSEILKRAFVGLKQLPEQAESLTRWWETLKIDRRAPIEAITEQYRSLARQHHPDQGGDSHQWALLSESYALAKKEKGVK